jgi:Protein of unknown function (DUF1573)
MKNIFILAIVALFAVACEETDKGSKTGSGVEVTTDDPATLTTIEWIDSVKNYGTITEGQQLAVSFRFKNTGDKPLVIKNVHPSCGCTVPTSNDKPIAPGAEGTIDATFNSQNKEGRVNKELTVETNAKNAQTYVLHFQVDVTKAAPVKK